MTFAEGVLAGKRRALARLITRIENRSPGATEDLSHLFKHTGRAHLIGVTGAPGTGKSSLVNRLTLTFREQNQTVAIVAVDPTSPFSGGAILGDRIRMRDLSGDPGVFIRSMASRGSLGGLASTTADVVKVLDAAGFDRILVETVGAGQSEVDIARHAQTILVVEAPGLGDDVQAIKAGILEIADILIVNKADDPRARKTAGALQTMLDLGSRSANRRGLTSHHGQVMEAVLPPDLEAEDEGWHVPICLTNALSGEGLAKLVATIDAHRAHLVSSGELILRDRVRMAAELDRLLRNTLLERLLNEIDRDRLAEVVAQIEERDLIPQAAVALLIDGEV